MLRESYRTIRSKAAFAVAAGLPSGENFSRTQKASFAV